MITFISRKTSLFRSVVLAIAIFSKSYILPAQNDHEFWFVAPDVSQSHASGYPSRFVCTTTDFAAYVTIEMPKNSGFTTKEIYIPAGESRFFWFLNSTDEDLIENNYSTTYNPLIPGANNKGIRIRSRAIPRASDIMDVSKVDINVYYDYMSGGVTGITSYFPDGEIKTIATNAQNNPEIYNLLGNNALGIEFFTVFQTDLDNKKLAVQEATSAFDIVFTEDNTFLTLTIPAGKYLYNPNGSPFSDTTVILGPFARGESYKGVPAVHYPVNEAYGVGEIFGRSKDDRLTGVKIQSNRKIAVTLSDDSMFSSGCYNLGGDQTIPTSLIGRQYFAQKGNLEVSLNMENVYVTSIAANTRLYVNGVLKSILNEGNTFTINIDSFALISSPDTNFYALQITGTGCETGMAILPPIDACTGTNQISFTRPVASNLDLMLLCRTGAESYFSIEGESGMSGGTINGAIFKSISGNTNWKYLKLKNIPENQPASTDPFIKTNISTRITNSKDVFHLGVINASAGGTRYAYFSNFNTTNSNVSAFIVESSTNTIKLNFGETAQLVAQGGTSYHWSPESFLTDPYSSHPIAYPPPGNHIYTATVQGYCNQPFTTNLSIIVAPKLEPIISLDTAKACGSANIKIRNTSKGLARYWLDFGDGSQIFYREYKVGGMLQNQSSIDTTMEHTYNTLATDENFSLYRVVLITENSLHLRDTIIKEIEIYPKVAISSLISDTSICDSTKIAFIHNTSNAQSYAWNFGDGTTSILENPNHVFRNTSNTAKNYSLRLIANSIYGCIDTAYRTITVHPYINANFTFDNVKQCSPAAFNISNTSWGKGGAITDYSWRINDSIFSSLANPNSLLLTNTSGSAKSFPVQLKISNNEGEACAKTKNDTVTVFPMVYSGFTPSATSGCNPMSIEFISNSNNESSITHSWNFGDGTTSIIENPNHTFENTENIESVFVTKHTVTSANNCKSETSQSYAVKGLLEAGFTINATEACDKILVTFNNRSKGNVGTYEWDFDGDGTTDSTSIAFFPFSHLYKNETSTNVTFTPSLTVRNAEMSCFSKSISTPILIHPKVIAAFSVNDTIGVNPVTIEFTNTSNSPIAKYFIWNFGDGSATANQHNISHEYKTTSILETSFNAKLIASSEDGCSDSASINITIQGKTNADFILEKSTLCSGETLEVKNNSTVDIIYNRWDFGDGTILIKSDNSDVSHTYQNLTVTPKTYLLKLFVENNNAVADSFTQTITVYPQVISSFNSDKTSGCNPLAVNFTNNSNTASSYYNWVFGDGTTTSLTNPTHIFTNSTLAAKTFNVELIATSSYLCTDTAIVAIEVYPTAPKANFKVDKTEICSGNSIQITDEKSSGTAYLKWDFEGDGIIDSETLSGTFEHIYKNSTSIATTQNLTMVVSNRNNCSDIFSISILVYPEVKANFDANSFSGCSPLDVNFTNTTNAGATYFKWNFGDGNTSNLKNPAHTYVNKKGTSTTFEAKLIALNQNLCVDSVTKKFSLFPTPQSNFKLLSNKGISLFNIELINYSTGETNYLWNFGDGNTSEENTPTHSYTNTSKNDTAFEISLKVSNEFNCENTSTDSIHVSPQIVNTIESLSASIQIYPIPFEDVLTIESEFSIVKVEIYDIQGVIVFNSSVKEKKICNLNLSMLKPDFYYIKTIGKAQSDYRKIIKR